LADLYIFCMLQQEETMQTTVVAKNYKNWPMFHGAIQKIKVALFMARGVYSHSNSRYTLC